MGEKRYYSLSLYRLIATILVLQFHIFFFCFPIDITNTIYLSKFLLGLTALSGFIFSSKKITSIKEFYLTRIKRLLIPAIIALILMVIWNLLFMLITHHHDFISTFVGYRAYNHGLLIEPGNFYYIPYILFCYLITPFLDKKWWISLIIFVLVLGIETTFIIKVEPTYIATSYLIGYFAGKKFFNVYVDKYQFKDLLHLLIWSIIFVGSILLTHYMLVGVIRIKGSLHYIIRGFSLMVFGVSTLFIFLLLSKFINRLQKIKFLDFTDKLTYEIFLLNQTFMCGAMNVTTYVSPMYLKTILVYIFTISFSIGVYFLSTRVNKLIKKDNKVL